MNERDDETREPEAQTPTTLPDESIAFCDECGHYHDPDEPCKPAGPCGSYLCCIN